MNYAGVPVGLELQAIDAGASVTLSVRTELTLLLTRLRWSVPISGLVLMDAKVHNISLVSSVRGPAMPLEGNGVWRFPPEIGQVSTLLSVVVMNLSAARIQPRAIAFWGLPWDRLTPYQKARARWGDLERP